MFQRRPRLTVPAVQQPLPKPILKVLIGAEEPRPSDLLDLNHTTPSISPCMSPLNRVFSLQRTTTPNSPRVNGKSKETQCTHQSHRRSSRTKKVPEYLSDYYLNYHLGVYFFINEQSFKSL